jgi:hypothetical protein
MENAKPPVIQVLRQVATNSRTGNRIRRVCPGAIGSCEVSAGQTWLSVLRAIWESGSSVMVELILLASGSANYIANAATVDGSNQEMAWDRAIRVIAHHDCSSR